MSSEEPFIYTGLLAEISVNLGRWLITGGPKMGKSTLLLRLHAILERRHSEVRLVRCTSSADVEALRRWLEQGSSPEGLKGIMLIDDLDIAYDTELESAFKDLYERPPSAWSDAHIIATSSTPNRIDSQGRLGLNEKPAGPVRDGEGGSFPRWNPKMVDSRGLSRLTPEYLDPWILGGWDERARLACLKALRGTIGEQVQAERIDAVSRIVARVSGGHPLLLGAATRRVSRRLLAEAVLSDGAVSEGVTDLDSLDPGWSDDDMLEKELEIYLVNTIGGDVTSALRWALYQLPRTEVERLLELARDRADEAELGGINIFRRAGLVRLSDGELTFSCAAIRSCLRSLTMTQLLEPPKPTRDTAEPGQPDPGLSVELRPDASRQAGTIRWHDGTTERSLEIPPAEWQVIEHLAAAHGEVVSVSEMAGGDNEKEQMAIRSALQRLQKMLKLVELSDLIINVPRKGYRLTGGYPEP